MGDQFLELSCMGLLTHIQHPESMIPSIFRLSIMSKNI